jgi:glycosyltransferase involved in cell wall biosynthesis
MNVSFNILTWNNVENIDETLNAVKQEYDSICNGLMWDCEIIVVDNFSKDGTLEKILEFYDRFPYLKLIIKPQHKNTGISRGKNVGIDNSMGEYIMMLDGDIIPVENSVYMLASHMNLNKYIKALGFRPNKWVRERDKAEARCNYLYKIEEINAACLYYGMYHRDIFDAGVRLSEEGAYGREGYGWEDHDFYEQLRDIGVRQYACHINSEKGRYYHGINSSIRAMGTDKYIQTSHERAKQFHKKWDKNGQIDK